MKKENMKEKYRKRKRKGAENKKESRVKNK
jgi:hypothetical protein